MTLRSSREIDPFDEKGYPVTAPTMAHRLAAEFIGTFLLVLGGCGAAVFAANPAGDGSVGIGFLGVALAFGLTVLTGVYAFGTISGGHFNPAVTFGGRARPTGGMESSACLLGHPGGRRSGRRCRDLLDRLWQSRFHANGGAHGRQRIR